MTLKTNVPGRQRLSLHAPSLCWKEIVYYYCYLLMCYGHASPLAVVSTWQPAKVCAMLQVPVKRKGVHWTKLSSCLVQGSVFARDESDLIFNMSHLGAGFQVSHNP